MFDSSAEIQIQKHAAAVAPEVAETGRKGVLKMLGKFVTGHSFRKVTSNWDIIEARFKDSSNQIITVQADGNVLKMKTLHLSALADTLMSPLIKVKYNEVVSIFPSWAFLTTRLRPQFEYRVFDLCSILRVLPP